MSTQAPACPQRSWASAATCILDRTSSSSPAGRSLHQFNELHKPDLDPPKQRNAQHRGTDGPLFTDRHLIDKTARDAVAVMIPLRLEKVLPFSTPLPHHA